MNLLTYNYLEWKSQRNRSVWFSETLAWISTGEGRYFAFYQKLPLKFLNSHLRHLSHLSQDKTKLLFSFFLILFNYAIQGKFVTWLVNYALNCTWKPISHSSLRDSCDIGFQVQFNAEFPRQVMNFPIIAEFQINWNILRLLIFSINSGKYRAYFHSCCLLSSL